MRRGLLTVLFSGCLFALVFGMKLEVIDRFGTDLARWDALDAEGLGLLVPLAEGRLRFGDLFQPHNEHRIVWTKLLGLAELQLNGQWDARLQCTVNAALHSLVAVGLFLFARRGLAPRLHAPVFVLIALLIGLPLAWQNPIAGFHSQQYFLLGFSLGAIVLLPSARAWSPRWWTGAACTLAALGTMGSGLFAAAIVLFVLALQGWGSRDFRGVFRRALPTVAVCLVALGLGALGRVSVDYHDSLKAGSVGEFLLYTLHCLQWPAERWSWLAAPLWLPVLLLTWQLVRRAAPPGPFPLALLGLAAWVVLQILATAYTRGAGAGLPSSRYIDTLTVGVIANGLALAWLWPQLPRPVVRLVLAAAWLLALAVPGYRQARIIFDTVLPGNRLHLEACEENVRRYLATDDPAQLEARDMPYPDRRALRDRLDHPAIRARLPVSVRRPLPLAPSSGSVGFAEFSTIQRVRSAASLPTEFSGWPATLPTLTHRSFWSATGEGTFRAPLAIERDCVLRLLVAGQGAVSLALVYPSATLNVDLGGVTAGAWKILHVAVPRGRAELQAHVAADSRLVFGEPVEMAVGSYWCRQLVRMGRGLWSAAAGLALLGGLGAWYCASREKALG